MAVRDVVTYPDRRLKEVCVSALTPGVDVERIAADLIDTMRIHTGCVGIAAPQIGEMVRMAVVEVAGHKKAVSDHGLLVLCDPVIVEEDGSIKMREGCLSIPDLTGNVTRPEQVLIEATTLDSKQRFACDAYEARVVLHELDHLDGVLFIDRVASATDIFPRKRST